MLFVVSLIIALLTAYQFNRFLHHEKFFDWLIGFVLIVMTEMVFIFTVAGLFYQMNNQLIILLMQAGLMGGAFLLVWRMKAYLHPMPMLTKESFDLSKFPKALLGFALIMGGVLALNLVYVLYVPPSNNDSLMIHLARVGMWHQTGSWLPWNTPVIWQLSFPFHSEMMAYWSLLFLKREALLAFFPFLCAILSTDIIYHLGTELFHKKASALWAALIWLTLPVVQLNLSSSRHDHVSTFLLITAIYFFFINLRLKNRSNWFLVGLSLALSVGTNFAVGGYLPGFVFFFLIAWLGLKAVNGKDILRIGLYGIFCFLIISSPIYISNTIHFGSPLGSNALSMTGQGAVEEGTIFEHILLVDSRWDYQMLDCHGLPDRLIGYCHKAKALAGNWISETTGLTLETKKSLLNAHEFNYDEFIPMSEDSAWFGVVGGIIFYVVGVYSLIVSIKRKSIFFIAVSSFWITAPIMLAVLRAGWTPYDGRYFIFLMALLCIAMIEALWHFKSFLRTGLMSVFTLVALLILAVTILQNPAKSFYGYRAFYNIHRFDMISVQSYFTKEMLYLVDQTVPEDATLGIARPDREFYEYGLFGEYFTRQIVPVYPLENVCDLDWLQAQDIGYLLLNVTDEGMPDCEIDGYHYLNSMKDWMILGED